MIATATAHAHLDLPHSLALARACLNGPLALAFDADDPLRLDLPPLLGADSGGLSPQALRAVAALYFQAELEQAGVIPVAELLVEARLQQAFGSVRVAEKLEAFAQRGRGRWYDRAHRQQLFARLFGTGPAATNDAGATVNREFEQRLAGLCLALARYAADLRFSSGASSGSEAAVRTAAVGLLSNLAPRQFGNTLIAGRLIQEELQAAIDLLNDPEVGALFGVRGLWPTLRQILGDQAPDLQRLVDRAQAGLRLIEWLAAALPQLTNSAGPLPLPEPSIFASAATWLQATGLDPAAAGGRAA